MERGTSDKTLLDEFVLDFVKIVENHCKYIIVSGYVVISHGRSRATEDVDMILERIPKEKFVALHNDILKSGFECMQSKSGEEVYTQYLENNTSVRYTRKGSMIPEMEVKLSKDELDDEQLITRKKLGLTGLDVYFSSIEMNIAFKEELLKSDKDLEDARHLRIVYEDELDESEIKKIKGMIRRLRL